MNEKKISLKAFFTDNLKELLCDCDVLYLDKSDFGGNEDAKLKHNIYGLARVHEGAKKVVIQLSNLGYYMVDHKDGVSVFYNFKNKEIFDRIFFKDGFFRFRSLYYSIDNPPSGVLPTRLLVVFSSVADFPYNASIIRRCFFKNFANVSKYIPCDTIVVRVSDIGPVVGSFYLNNNYNSEVESDVRSLLSELHKFTGICKKNTVLYGVSKGGTGALYHGLKAGFGFVAVDPIVSDEHHENKYADSHFTEGTFPNSKQSKFNELLTSSIDLNSNFRYIITSRSSPIFSYIKEANFQNFVKVIDVCRDDIKDHPDVGPNTVNILLMILNAFFYKVNLHNGEFSHSRDRLLENDHLALDDPSSLVCRTNCSASKDFK